MNPRLFTRISAILVLMMSSVSLTTTAQANAEDFSEPAFQMRSQSTSHARVTLPSAQSGLISLVFRADFLGFSDSPYMLFPKGTHCRDIWYNTRDALRFDWLNSHQNDIDSTVNIIESCQETADGVKVWIEATMDALTERGNTLLQEYVQLTQGNTLYSYPVKFAQPQKVNHEILIEGHGLEPYCAMKTIVPQMDPQQSIAVCDEYARMMQSSPSQKVFRDFALKYFAPDAIDHFVRECAPVAKVLWFKILPIYRDNSGHKLRRWYYGRSGIGTCPAEGCLAQ